VEVGYVDVVVDVMTWVHAVTVLGAHTPQGVTTVEMGEQSLMVVYAVTVIHSVTTSVSVQVVVVTSASTGAAKAAKAAVEARNFMVVTIERAEPRK